MALYIDLPALIPLTLAGFGLAYLIYAQIEKTWLPPLISFILLASASIISIGGEFTMCEGAGCTNYQIFIPALAYTFGGLSLLAILMLILRVIENFGDKQVEY